MKRGSGTRSRRARVDSTSCARARRFPSRECLCGHVAGAARRRRVRAHGRDSTSLTRRAELPEAYISWCSSSRLRSRSVLRSPMRVLRFLDRRSPRRSARGIRRALRRELELRFGGNDRWTVDTLYFGGGTPSRLGGDGVASMLSMLAGGDLARRRRGHDRGQPRRHHDRRRGGVGRRGGQPAVARRRNLRRSRAHLDASVARRGCHSARRRRGAPRRDREPVARSDLRAARGRSSARGDRRRVRARARAVAPARCTA